MTVTYGLGMFFFSMGALIVGSLIVFYVINKVEDNDKKGKILYRTVTGTMDLVELEGEYHGEKYDLLKIEEHTTGAYGTAKFTVSYFSNDQLHGATSGAEVITGGLQHIHNGIYGRFQGASLGDGSVWYIEVYGSHVKQTNKSNASIELSR